MPRFLNVDNGRVWDVPEGGVHFHRFERACNFIRLDDEPEPVAEPAPAKPKAAAKPRKRKPAAK